MGGHMYFKAERLYKGKWTLGIQEDHMSINLCFKVIFLLNNWQCAGNHGLLLFSVQQIGEEA